MTVIRGDLIHDLGTKQRIVFESEEPVTGVQLSTNDTLTTLFVSTTSRILKLGLSRKGQGLPPKTVEDAGCGAGCMTLDKKTGNVIVAREDAIYTYTLDGRGPPRAYESPKNQVAIYENYVALACPPASDSAKDSEAMRRRFGSQTADALFSASTFVLLEPDLRVIGHTENLISAVRFIVEVWGDLFTVTEEGKASILANSWSALRLPLCPGLSISRKGTTAKARDAISKKHVSARCGACTQRWHGQSTAKWHIPQIR